MTGRPDGAGDQVPHADLADRTLPTQAADTPLTERDSELWNPSREGAWGSTESRQAYYDSLPGSDGPDSVGGRDIVCLVDGRSPDSLHETGRESFERYRDELTPDRIRISADTGAEYDYQRQWCGEVEYRISPDADLPNAVWADGLDSDRGFAQDAKYVEADARSWFVPESLPPAVREIARESVDKRLLKYREVIDDQANPVRGLEIISNSADAAQYIAGRMNILNVNGIVRIRQ